MADKFIGKWVPDKCYGELEGFDAFVKALDTPKELLDQYKNAKLTLEYQRDGNGWKNIMSAGDKELRTQPFRLNEYIEVDGLDGSKYKFRCHMEGDTWIDESQPQDKSKKGTTTRKTVCKKDGKTIMTTITTINDLEPKVSITNVMTRV